MSKKREVVRNELLLKAEAKIDELLDWHDEVEMPNFDQIEEKVLQIRDELGQELSQELVTAQEATKPTGDVLCPECGQGMRYKGEKAKSIESLLGSLRVQRAYYYCSGCGTGHFPPGSSAGTMG